MDRPNEITTEANWLNTHVDTERANLVRQLFPFRTPPLDIARNCLIIGDPNLQLRKAFHDTSSTIFIAPRNDRKLLVPAIAFDDQAALNLWITVSDTLPKTIEFHNRKWAVWSGRNILQSIPTDLLTFTPEKGLQAIEQADEAKEIYTHLLEGKNHDGDRIRLRQIMSGFGLAGGWFRYYTDTLPQQAHDNPDSAESTVNGIFTGLENRIKQSTARYHELPNEDKELLNNPFRVIVKTKMKKPYAYFTYELDGIRKGEPNALNETDTPRDPLEIVGRTQGVDANEVDTVFIPDDAPTEAAAIVKRKIASMGLGDRIKSASRIRGVKKYETCDLRYGRFTTNLLGQYIREGRLKPLVPIEWRQSGVYNS